MALLVDASSHAAEKHSQLCRCAAAEIGGAHLTESGPVSTQPGTGACSIHSSAAADGASTETRGKVAAPASLRVRRSIE